MTTLSNAEKTDIVNQHLKNLYYNKFNIEMSLVEEGAKTTPEAESLTSLNTQLADFDSRIEALEEELDKLV